MGDRCYLTLTMRVADQARFLMILTETTTDFEGYWNTVTPHEEEAPSA